jgi:hypothetical protein
MQTIPSNKSNRCWTVAGLPEPDPRDPKELEIYVNYTGESTCANAVPLDSFVVPLFKLAPRLLEVVRNYILTDLVTLGLTPEELDEVKRLSGDHTIPRR